MNVRTPKTLSLGLSFLYASAALADENRFGVDAPEGAVSGGLIAYIIVALLLFAHEDGLLHDWANEHPWLAVALFLFVFPAIYAFNLLGWVLLCFLILIALGVVIRPSHTPSITQRQATSSVSSTENSHHSSAVDGGAIFLDVPWAENEYQANKYRKLLATGHTFTREDNKIVATTPDAKRQAIYTSFDLDDLVEAAEQLHNTKATDTATQASVVFDANIELAKKISDRRIVILIIRQWEDGPWVAGAYKARDAVIAYINTTSPSVSYTLEDEVIKAAIAHSEALFSTLYESGVEPLDSEIGADKLVIAETLVARMKRTFRKEVAN